jgi:hypothetical protein
MKLCKRCLILKDFSEFYKQKKGKFGLKPECKDCIKLYNKANSEYQSLYFKNRMGIKSKKNKPII